MENRTAKHILLGAIPGLMFFIFQVGNFSFRLSWQLVSIWLAGVAFAALLSSWFWRIFFLLALAQVIFNEVVITSYITLMMIAIFLGAAEGFSRIKPDHIMDAMCVAGLLLSLWVIGQRVGILPAFSLGASGAGPFNRVAGSVFLALCLPAFLRDGQSSKLKAQRFLCHVRMWYLLPVVGVGLWLCRSSTGTIAALAGLAVWTLISRPGMLRVGAVAVLVFMLCGLFFWKVDPVENLVRESGRWPAWKHACWSIGQAPFGRGLGSFAQIFPIMSSGDPKVPRNMVHAHGEFVQTGFEMGLQGMLLIAAYPFWIGMTAWRKRRRLTEAGKIAAAGIAALAVACLGWHTFHIAPLAVLGSAWLGMAHGEMKR